MVRQLLTLLLLCMLSWTGCEKRIHIANKGELIGYDSTMGPCSGGWIIEIAGKTYVFSAFPEDNDFNMEGEFYPIQVRVSWNHIDACASPYGSRILIKAIKKR